MDVMRRDVGWEDFRYSIAVVHFGVDQNLGLIVLWNFLYKIWIKI